MLCQSVSDGTNPMLVKVCYLAQFRHLRFHAEFTVKHHSNVACDGSRLEDAVTDDDINQTVLASRARCSHPCFYLSLPYTCLDACQCSRLIIGVLDLK